MRNTDFTTSFSLVSRAFLSLGLAGGMVIGSSATCLAQNPAASQVEFDPEAKLPMDIMKGTKPATMGDTQFAGEEKASFVTISPDSDGRVADATDGSATPAANRPASAGVADPRSRVADGTVSDDAKESPPLSKRALSQIDRLTTQLVSQSRDAWMRGLMDQASYAAWLDVAATAQLRIAAHQGDRDRALIVLREQIALWTEAANQLEAFNQPAARGWEADLSHSRMMAVRAELRYRSAAGRKLTSYDKQAYSQLAAQHLDLRLQDFRTGTGTAAALLAAAKMVDEQIVAPQPASESAGSSAAFAVPTFQVDRPSAIRAALVEIQRPVHLETYPFAISTRDLAEDRRAVQRASTFAAFAAAPEDARDSDRFLSDVDQHAESIAANQFAGYQTGTATPGGMLREWWSQETIAGTLDQDLSDSAFSTAQTRRLQAIHQVAVSTSDLRGRNAADVAAAEMLVAVRQLDLRPPSDAKKNASYDETPSSSEALVIEYEANDATTEPVEE
ncbi:MAG: hypothetical protein ACI8P0_001803 [Planctomycetaceae bacterium]|jgi:hypothetical protein